MKKWLFLIIVFVGSIFQLFSTDKKTTTINRIKLLEGDMQITSNDYLIENSYIKLVKAKTNKKDFLSAFKVKNVTLDVECNNSTNYIGSACLMQAKDLSMQTTPYSIVVTGDVTGDGLYTITDIVKIAQYSNDKSALSKKSYVMAADIDNDNIVTSTDISSVAYHSIINKELEFSKDSTQSTNIELLTKTLILSRGFNSQIEVKVNNDVSIIDWKSSNEDVVKVDSTGLVTGVGSGNATITATTSKGDTASVQASIIVVVPATGVSLSNISSQMEVGETQKLKATVSPGDATNKNVTWKSSDKSIAIVDSDGKVTAISDGTVKITATTATGKNATATISVIVPVTKVTLNKTSISMVKKETTTLTATIIPSNASNRSIKWSSSNKEVATVDSNGKVTAVSNGEAIITATSSDGKTKATCKVTVNELKLTLSHSTVTLVDEKAKVLTATLSSTSIDQSVTWSSSNKEVATVDNNGKVKAKSTGTATITATSNFDSSVSDKCVVTVRAARVLFVGNSKTYYPGAVNEDDGIPKRFKAIAKNAGYEIEYVLAVKPKASLKALSTEYLDVITSKNFDYAILQEGTGAYAAESGTRYYTGVSNIFEAVTEKNSSIKIYLRKLWTRTTSTTSERKIGYNYTLNIVDKIKEEKGYTLGVINDGPAFYDILDNYNISIFKSNDDIHQNANGAYLSALCIYSTIYGNDPTKITYNASIDSTTVSTLKTIAKEHCYSS